VPVLPEPFKLRLELVSGALRATLTAFCCTTASIAPSGENASASAVPSNRAMDDPCCVGGGHAFGDFVGQGEHLAGTLDRRQRTALEELHDEVSGPDVIELTDVGVIERRDRPRLALAVVAEWWPTA